MSESVDQLTEAIARAVKASDAEAIEVLFLALTKLDPQRAKEVWATFEYGIALGRAAAQSDGSES